MHEAAQLGMNMTRLIMYEDMVYALYQQAIVEIAEDIKI